MRHALQIRVGLHVLWQPSRNITKSTKIRNNFVYFSGGLMARERPQCLFNLFTKHWHFKTIVSKPFFYCLIGIKIGDNSHSDKHLNIPRSLQAIDYTRDDMLQPGTLLLFGDS